MSDEKIPTFRFYRTGDTVTRNGVIGNRGILEAGGKEYQTIERDIDRYVNIPFGRFPLDMEISPNVGGRKQFRIMNHDIQNKDKVYAALLIHAGSYPDELTGCIAPGRKTNDKGVEESRLAMDELFSLCGGFQTKSGAAILEVVPK